MSEKTVSYEEFDGLRLSYEKELDGLRAEYAKASEDNYNEAHKVIQNIQSELNTERTRSDMYRAIAYLEKAYLMPELSDFQGQLRSIVSILWKRAEDISCQESNGSFGIPNFTKAKLKTSALPTSSISSSSTSPLCTSSTSPLCTSTVSNNVGGTTVTGVTYNPFVSTSAAISATESVNWYK